MPATRRYEVHLCGIKTQEIAAVEGVLGIKAGGILLDGGLLHNRLGYCDSVCWRLLGSTPATRRYKVRPCRSKTQDITVFCGGGAGY